MDLLTGDAYRYALLLGAQSVDRAVIRATERSVAAQRLFTPDGTSYELRGYYATGDVNNIVMKILCGDEAERLAQLDRLNRLLRQPAALSSFPRPSGIPHQVECTIVADNYASTLYRVSPPNHRCVSVEWLVKNGPWPRESIAKSPCWVIRRDRYRVRWQSIGWHIDNCSHGTTIAMVSAHWQGMLRSRQGLFLHLNSALQHNNE